MGWSTVCKVLQKQTHDFLSHRHGTIVLTLSCVLIVVSAFQFGEVVLEWSTEKYAAVFNSYSDNIAGKSYRTRLCLPVPIDVVYTWVNGSDPKLIAELRREKMLMEQQLNETSTLPTPSDKCTFPHCVAAHAVVLEPAIPADLDLSHLSQLYPAYRDAIKVYPTVNPANNANISIIMFEDQNQVEVALNSTIFIDGKNISVRMAYFTSDWTLPNAVILNDILIMTGFPHTMDKDALYEKIPTRYQKAITKFELHTETGVAIITLPIPEEFDAMLKNINITIDNKTPSLTSANLVWDLTDYSLSEDVASNRYQDNEELRYSLRSIEQYAPWVRHVYIVTNGQIPGWLNLDSPRLTVVSHLELFPNKTHLPTFSSPAIEAHIHRIPGLSDKFIYMNDDVMFGKEVWPDDFYTHSRGQKVYLSWPVPNCQEGCPSSWIRDGYCDKACNNSECEWDGGDCKGGAQRAGVGVGGQDFGGYTSDSTYCNTGCSNSWIADRYCDNACNVYPCGFDAGDCGTQTYGRLHAITLDKLTHHYNIPQGDAIFYFNITNLLGENGTISEATYSESDTVRTVAVALKFKVITVVLYGNKSAETVNLTLKGTDNFTTPFKLNLTIAVDTRIISKKADIPQSILGNDTEGAVNRTRIKFEFNEIPLELQLPRAAAVALDEGAISVEVNMSLYELPPDIDTRWSELLSAYQQGDLTEKGFRQGRGHIWTSYLQLLQDQGLKPVKRNLTTIITPESKGKEHLNKTVESHLDKNVLMGNDKEIIHAANGNNINQNQFHDENDGLQAKVENVQDSLKIISDDEKMNIHQEKVVENVNLEVNQGRDEFPERNLAPRAPANQGLAQEQEVLNDMKSIKEYLHNVSSKLRSMNASNQIADVKEQKLILQDPMENLVKDPNLDWQEQNREQPRQAHHDETLEEDKGQGHDGNFKSRKLNSLAEGDLVPDANFGFLPWEKHGTFNKLQKRQEAKIVADNYQVAPLKSRKLLDTFGDSLRHVNKLYNKAFGYVARKVPSHMPHMIDKNIMFELQNKFPEEWDVTSSHKVRSSDDMQYMFSYVYYLMGEPQPLTVKDVFDEIDLDKSGVLSDREVRTLATRLFEPPLDLQTLTGLENKLANCSAHAPPDPWASSYREEKYYESIMPQVTRHLIENCEAVISLMEKVYKSRTKYKHEILGDEEVAFKMIRTNVSQVVGQLDDIRRHPKKFVCLNDNIDHSNDGAKTVKAVLVDFYESLYPNPSSFELPREYRNRFLHLDELREWRKYRDWLKLWTQIALVFLILFTIASFFSDKIEALQKKYFGRRRTTTTESSSGVPQRPIHVV